MEREAVKVLLSPYYTVVSEEYEICSDYVITWLTLKMNDIESESIAADDSEPEFIEFGDSLQHFTRVLKDINHTEEQNEEYRYLLDLYIGLLFKLHFAVPDDGSKNSFTFFLVDNNNKFYTTKVSHLLPIGYQMWIPFHVDQFYLEWFKTSLTSIEQQIQHYYLTMKQFQIQLSNQIYDIFFPHVLCQIIANYTFGFK